MREKRERERRKRDEERRGRRQGRKKEEKRRGKRRVRVEVMNQMGFMKEIKMKATKGTDEVKRERI